MSTLPDAVLLPLLAIAMLMPRWLGVIYMLPVFSFKAMPHLLRQVVALVLTFPLVQQTVNLLQQSALTGPGLMLLAGKELMIGLLLGTVLAIPFWIFEAAGVYLDNQRGANVQAINPTASADASMLGLALQQALTVAMLHAGLAGLLLSPVYQSYQLWPVLASMPAMDAAMLARLLPLLTRLMNASLILASPGLICLGLVETCFAVLSRWNPQLPAYSAALPVKSLLALLVVMLSLPLYWQIGENMIVALPGQVHSLLAAIPASGT